MGVIVGRGELVAVEGLWPGEIKIFQNPQTGILDSLTKWPAGPYQSVGRLCVLSGGGEVDTHRDVDTAQEEQQLAATAVLERCGSIM